MTSCLGLPLETGLELEVSELDFDWRKGDKLLLCSDGLNDELEDTTMQQLMLVSPDSKDQTQSLLDAALKAGGRDNTSIIIIEAPSQPSLWHKLMHWISRKEKTNNANK